MKRQSQEIRVGTQAGAEAAVNVHTHAGERTLTGAGELNGWTWHRGKTRVAWRQEDSPVVYKIETTPGQHANENEHRYASMLRHRAEPWAPETHLYAAQQMPGGFVLAMTYYPIPVLSRDEIPKDALELLSDQLLTNFRRTAARPGGEVKVIDLGDLIPWLK